MTNEQILEVAKTCGFGDTTYANGNQWECWEEQLIEFAEKIYEMGYDNGYNNGAIDNGGCY
jgi:hypothetical protein